jgi:hypothetical protein
VDGKRQILRHYLASLAYRTQKALRGAPPGFGDYRAQPGVRTPHEILYHIIGVLAAVRWRFVQDEWRPTKAETFEAEVRRFHDILQEIGGHLAAGTPLHGTTPEVILQGPLSDAMTHVGQLAMLRRFYGSPVPPEDFMHAAIDADNLGMSQPAPVRPDEEWFDAEGRPEEAG